MKHNMSFLDSDGEHGLSSSPIIGLSDWPSQCDVSLYFCGVSFPAPSAVCTDETQTHHPCLDKRKDWRFHQSAWFGLNKA